jgi:PEP-CTERM motif
MKQILRMISVVAALCGLTVTSHAQIVWSQNFDSLTLGTYGTTADYGGGMPEATSIVTPGDGGVGNAMQVTFYPVSGSNVNFQAGTPAYAASGNTSATLADYTLSFDLAIQGVDISTGYGGLQISVQDGGGIFGSSAVSPFVTPAGGTAGSGYQHYSYNLGTFTGSLNPTSANLAFGIGVVAFGNNMTASPETLLVDNVQVTMVPEPSTFAMILGGLGLFAGWRRYRRA